MISARPRPVIAVLGASGLIGDALCVRLTDGGHDVVPVARRFTPSQTEAFGERAFLFPLVDADAAALGALLAGIGAEIVVNCVGTLQDSAHSSTDDVHRGFASRLTAAMTRPGGAPMLLVHFSIPGRPDEDGTAFSRTKRMAETAIAESGVSYVIIRPGFVAAAAAYGGSALMRALAVTPLRLPRTVAESRFSVTDLGDLAGTVEHLARRWTAGEQAFSESWDVMESGRSTVGDVLEALSRRLGGPRRRFELPLWLLGAGCYAGDLAARLGWRPPIRSTALAEMRRGVAGDPSSWSAATGIVPRNGMDVLRQLPATVQDRWFARLYLLKAVAIAVLASFWIVSGVIALTIAFDAATTILVVHGFEPWLAKAITVFTSLLDISVGILIAIRARCRFGLLAGIAVSLFYMAGAAVITPDMWIEPLGALVKTGPAIVLMIVALATLDDR